MSQVSRVIFGEIEQVDPEQCIFGPNKDSLSRCASCKLTGRLGCIPIQQPRPTIKNEVVIVDGVLRRRCVSQQSPDCEKTYIPGGRRKYCPPCGIVERKLRQTRHWRLR